MDADQRSEQQLSDLDLKGYWFDRAQVYLAEMKRLGEQVRQLEAACQEHRRVRSRQHDHMMRLGYRGPEHGLVACTCRTKPGWTCVATEHDYDPIPDPVPDQCEAVRPGDGERCVLDVHADNTHTDGLTPWELPEDGERASGNHPEIPDSSEGRFPSAEWHERIDREGRLSS